MSINHHGKTNNDQRHDKSRGLNQNTRVISMMDINNFSVLHASDNIVSNCMKSGVKQMVDWDNFT